MPHYFSAARFCRMLCAVLALVTAASHAAEEPILKFGKAVEDGDLDVVQKMLGEGVDPNTRVPGAWLNYTPLFLAVTENRIEVTRALLKAGADPSIEDGNGDPVMVLAAHRDRVAHARLLIEHGISIDSKNHRGITALMRGAPYEKGPDVQTLVDLGANLDLPDPQGNTGLMIAAQAGNLAAMEVLIAAGAKLDLRNKAGETALILTAGRDAYDDKDNAIRQAVQLLIKGGADINLRDASGRSALMRAIKAWRGKPEMIEVLLAAGPDVRFRDEEGRDALFLAVSTEERKIHVARLLELGADLKTTDNEGVDLLMLAAGNTDPAQVRDFIERGLSPLRKTRTGVTAIQYAIPSRRPLPDPFTPNPPAVAGDKIVEILELLHQHGASLTAADADGDTPLHLAAMGGVRAVVAYLLPQFPDPGIRNGKGETPLHFAATAGSAETLELFQPRGADIDVRDCRGRTPLMYATAVAQRDAVLRLAAAGADINATAADGSTALAVALVDNETGTAKFLLEHGADPKRLRDPGFQLLRAARRFHDRPMLSDDYAFLIGLFAGLTPDVNLRDGDDMSALMWVAASNNLAALKAIIERGPDLQARSPDGRTALMWAATSCAVEAMQALRAAGADESLRDATGRTAAEWLAWSEAAPQADARDVPAGQPPLDERITRARRAALQDYLKQDVWHNDDRIAGVSPLHLAAALGDPAAITALIKRGAPPNILLADQSTPLMEAASNGQLKAVEVLLEMGADPALRDAGRQRAIDHAVNFRHPEVARRLLRQQSPSADDETSLLVALIQGGDEKLVRDFLQAGAAIPPPGRRVKAGESFNNRTPDPGAPLAAAAYQPEPRMLQVLMEFPVATGANEPDFLIAALHLAAANGRLANVRYLVEERKVDPDVLLADSFGGVTVMSSGDSDGKGPKPPEGYSALSRALEEGYPDVVRYLVKRGVTITGRTRGGTPPLTFVVEHHQPDLLQLFLENHAPTELVDLDGQTALHRAAAANDAAAVRLLLKHGADPKAKTRKGQTPLDLARKEQAAATAALLQDHPE